MKLAEFKESLRKKRIDCALLFNLGDKKDPNLGYFLQKDVDFACLALGKEDFLLAPESEKGQFKIKRIRLPKKGKLFVSLNKNLDGCKTIGLNMDFVSVNLLKEIKKQIKNKRFKDISKVLYSLRKTKTGEEIRLIRKSYEITDRIMGRLFDNFKKFKRPLEASLFLKNEAEKAGCSVAFSPIITQDFKTIHPEMSKERFKKGFCIVDFGVKYKGYCSDLTRTVYIGKPGKKEVEMYDFLLRIQENSIKKIKINNRCADLDKEARKMFGKYERYFKHGLGHGLGVEIHEDPSLRMDSKDKFEKDMVFTIEPGIYFKNKGIRIEDGVLLKKDGVEVLAKTGRKMRTI